ncbi:MAG: recombinase family protein [Parasporobacterium sp.]|nr:recombinase family protein [Parasporobacterium sp.]
MKITKIHYSKEQKKVKRDVLRVAAYCRVSTKYEGQLESFETQKAVYTDLINSREGWELAGIYADRGISGTRSRKRPQFMQLIEDCEKGLVDCIICKSVSRFARCSRDMLLYVRHLQNLGIRLIFEEENIDTENNFSEFLLTIRSAFSEEESRSLSENVKWSKRKKAQAGEVPMVKLYGFDNSGENYEIIPEEAEIVRFIFDRYEHGDNASQIAETLKARGIPSAQREAGWTSYSVGILLDNEKYIGDYRTQKTFTADFINKTKKKNDGILPSVYIKNHHPAIISRSQFERCSVIRNLRSINRGHGVPRYPFGEYLRCPHCGHVLFLRERRYYCEGEGACRKFVINAD